MSGAARGGGRSRSALTVWLVAWLGWGAVDGARHLAGELAALDASALERAVRAGPDERVRETLNPFGYRVLVLIAARTGADATVHLHCEPSPAMHRLWLGLSALLFPRSIVPRSTDDPLSPSVPSVVLAGADRPAPSPLAERVDGPGPPGLAVWFVPADAR